MILKRYKNNNFHNELLYEKKINNNTKKTKIEILAKINKMWNNDLTEKYKNINYLLNKNINELENILFECKNESKNENNIKNNDIIKKTVLELIEKYGNNEAIKNIYFKNDEIIIDLLCDTDIEKSVNEYNGFKINYNKICDINKKNNKNDVENGNINKDIIELQSHILKKYLNNK